MASTITPVTEWPDYNGDPTGGNPITHDLNATYDKVSHFRRDGGPDCAFAPPALIPMLRFHESFGEDSRSNK